MKRRSMFAHFALRTFPLDRRLRGATLCRVFGHRHNGLFCDWCWK